ncbi:Aerobic-type carbon monoxide dehydrogenase, small subunit, CoxS/CutS family [Streptomyces sp. MnatMP-M17]|uniref:(2Fe-2S)-binding protein n=1 Tax=Streptomyces sp. MnatMP-M17 TaxID=1839780 RepID=UPI00081E50D0|nr:Aerobic-type carbon monoxide dehydrogenase, small subunit, CoxS/CutS family [Streptomyces sp. MnatMP-M17]
MTTNENSGNAGNAAADGGIARGPGGWQPVPQGGEYDGESTAFVQLPPEDGQDAPLAAPGHGYVPPQITPLTPAEDTGGGVRWPDPRQDGGGQFQASYGQGGGYDPGLTGQWNFTGNGAGAGEGGGAPAESVGSSELTGQWTIPVANGDLPDESGEFSTSMLAAQWGGGSPPATLPGGAAAPWATEQADAQGVPLPNEQLVSAEGHDPSAHDPGIEAEHEHVMPPEPEALPEPEPEPEPVPEPLTSSSDSAEHPAGSYVLRVNGADRPVTDAWIGESLLYVLRERLGLAGAKDGCSQGECGACNVQVDGRLVASCLVPAATAAGSEVRTVEGLAADGEPSDVQRALAKCGAVQCGFCIPGMAMTVHDLLEGNHSPSELETRQALCGNLCRCSGYRGVLDAVNEVVAERTASAEAAALASEEARIPHQAPPGAGSAQPPHSPDGGMA